MNDWLKRSDAKRKKQANTKVLNGIDDILKKWQETKEGGDKLLAILNILATNVIEFAKPDMCLEDKIHNHRMMVRRAASSLPCIDISKGRTFNYLMTTMLCVLRQNTITKEELKEAHKEYLEYLASKHPRA